MSASKRTSLSVVGAVAALAFFTSGCDEPVENNTDGGTGTVIGETLVDIDTRTVTTHVGEAAIGSYLSDILKEELEKAGKPVDLAFVNSGAIRGGSFNASTGAFDSAEARAGRVYPKGPLTDVDVQGWNPFSNDHTTHSVSGTALKSILERSAAKLPPDLRNDEGGGLLQLAGGEYTIDCAGTPQALDAQNQAVQTEGTRITRIKVGNNVIYDAAGSIDQLAATTVTVGTNSFIGAGLDGHIAFQGTTQATIPIADLNFIQKVQDKVKATSPIEPKKSGRITVVGECGKPLTQP